MSRESNSSDATNQESVIKSTDTPSESETSSLSTSKKTVLNTDREYIEKFTQGEPIIDQRNPFKAGNKRPSSPTKIPQIEKEKHKNALNSLQTSPSDDLITTEEVLRQSKYVKTYIKNPDPYFVYDPAVLCRIKEEEQRRSSEINSEISCLKTPLSKKPVSDTLSINVSTSKLSHKKCSKPNYPNLADIKVKVGTDLEGTYLNPVEIKTNAKKFDERVKRINFNYDEDSEDMEEHLRKGSSSEESSGNIANETRSEKQLTENNNELFIKTNDSQDSPSTQGSCAETNASTINEGTFTNTISSKEFQKYLKKKGLILAPQQVSNGVKATHANGVSSKPNECEKLNDLEIPKSSNRRPDVDDVSLTDTPKKAKKSSLLQRLLANNIFFARRKTAPKDAVPKARSVCEGSKNTHTAHKEDHQLLPHKRRIVLESDTKRSAKKSPSLEFSYKSNPLQDCDTDKGKNDLRSHFEQSPLDTQDRLMKVERKAQLKECVYNELDKKKQQSFYYTNGHCAAAYSNPQTQTFEQMILIDRNAMVKRSKAAGTSEPHANLCADTQRKEPTTQSHQLSSVIRQRSGPLTSTPFRPLSSTDSHFKHRASSSTLTSSVCEIETESTVGISKNEFPSLKEHQRVQQTTDRDLYAKVLNRKLQNNENLYERLPTQRTQAEPAAVQPIYSSPAQSGHFVRGGPQRNTFCGVNRDRKYYFNNIFPATQQQAHSEDNFQLSTKNSLERIQPSRLSCRSTLSREEVLDRVRQFCRNSMRRNTEQAKHKNANEMRQSSSEISPASYDSVATHHFVSQFRQAGPQVPPRSQNRPLPNKESVNRQLFTAPIATLSGYAHDDAKGWLNSPGSCQESSLVKRQEYPMSENNAKGLPSERCLQRSTTGGWSGQIERSEKNFMCSRKTVQHSPIGGRNTPLILESSTNLQSRIYTPQRKGSVARRILKGNPIKNSNLRHGQYFSSSQNFYSGRLGLNPSPCADLGGLILRKEDWQNENKSGRQQPNEQQVNDERRRSSRREDPRRHTLGGDMLQYGVMQGQPQQRAMDLESQPVRSYAPVNQGPLFDDDPGIMSEVETASTGFRRGGKQRSSLPVVRTPSKTLERPLGLVFLQYRSETKRALLPNEITSIDTVRALFVRSFPRQLTMSYLEGPNVKIYIHDASKDMFYELEDVRSHLREIRDRSVLRLFESTEVAAPPQVLPGGPGIPQPLPQAVPIQWDQDQSYFSEPEFDSEYQHQHIHKSKAGKQPPYYVGTSQTLPRGMYSDRNKVTMGAPAKPLRSYGSRGNMGPIFPYPPDQLYSIPDGYTSSPERGTRGSYEEPYYSQYGTRGNVVAPIIDEENSEVAITEDQYALYGMKIGPGRIPRTANQMYDPTRPEDLHRIRVEHMERQLANLTGLVQKALVNQNPQIAPAAVPILNPNYLGAPAQCRDKSVSFEKSVSFSDDIQGVPKSHSPQHAADTKPTKPAIKSSTLPRTSSQERDRLKPPPPPKPIALTQTHTNYRADIALAPEVYNHLRGLQKKAKDLRMEVRTLRRLSQAQAVAVREDIKDAFMRIRATLLASSGSYWDQQGDQEKTRISREEELYKQEIVRLEKDLSDLETSVEGLRGEVINRRTRVNMTAVEDMALVLSRASKTVAELKLRFPGLSNGMRNLISNEMEKVVREEKFLKEEPDRLESALRRCKKLTGTLVTLKRLASVQEQRLPPNEPTPNEEAPCSVEITTANKQPVPTPRMGSIAVSGGVPPENALDALLDELQTFAKPLNQHNDLRPDDSTSDDSTQMIHSTVTTQIPQACLYSANEPNTAQSQDPPEQPKAAVASAPLNLKGNNLNMLQVNANMGSLRRLHSYPSGSDTDTSPPQPVRLTGKPPIPERNAELMSKVSNKRIPPPPPPRTSSRSPLASPTSPNVPHRMPSLSETESLIGNGAAVSAAQDGGDNSSGNESGNDQMQRQVALERRHQELLRKQKMLQEQYQRLQQMSKMPGVAAMPPMPSEIIQLKKTGSESNLPKKMDLSIANATGSMKNLNSEVISCSAGSVSERNEKNIQLVKQQLVDAPMTHASMGMPQLPRNEAVSGFAIGPAGHLFNSNSGSTATTTIGNTVTTTTTTIKQVYETEIL